MTTLTTNLEQELDALIAAHDARERADQEMRERARQEADAAQRLAFIADVEAELEDELRGLLGLTYNAPREARFDSQGATWYITPAPKQNERWMVSSAGMPNTYGKSGKLRETIMFALATYRMRLRDRARLDRAHAEHNARCAAEQAEQDAVRQVEREQIAQLIAAATAQANETRWRWPENVRVTLYHWQWVEATSVDDDGDRFVERGEGWSLFDVLDENGWIDFLPSAHGLRDRTVKLSMEHHKPVVEACSYGPHDKLPAALIEKITTVVPGVRDCTDWEASDNYELAEGEQATVGVGYQPLSWIRAAVEMAAEETASL